jgi:hypothetical protein
LKIINSDERKRVEGKIVDAKRNAPKTNRLHLKHDKSFKLLLSMKKKFIRWNAMNKQEINWKIDVIDKVEGSGSWRSWEGIERGMNCEEGIVGIWKVEIRRSFWRNRWWKEAKELSRRKLKNSAEWNWRT